MSIDDAPRGALPPLVSSACGHGDPRKGLARAVRQSVSALSLAWLCASVSIGCGRGEDGAQRALVLRDVPSAGPGFDAALFQSLDVRMVSGNEATLAFDGAAIDAVVTQIAAASESVTVLMYIWEPGKASDRVLAAIETRRAAGVSCRVVIDDFGSRKFLTPEHPGARLLAAGCEVRRFRPLPEGDKLARNHRKLVIVDGRVAITGGFGVRDDWLGDGVTDKSWRDTSVIVRGPAAAAAQQIFAESWLETGGPLLPPELFPSTFDPVFDGAPKPSRVAFVSSTASPNVTRAERLTELLFQAAKKRIWISNAYFVPSRALLDLLERKAAAGVDVRILVAGKKSDSKTSFGAQQGLYGSLLEKGARVFEYEPSMMHAKTLVVDDRLSLVGSMNLDPLGLNTLEEIGAVVDDPALNGVLAARFEIDCGRAQEKRK